MTTHSAALITCRVARIWSLISIIVVFAYFVGQDLLGGPPRTLDAWFGFALWPIGVSAGLIVAWYRERLGALLAASCLAAFCLWSLLLTGRLPQSLLFFVIAAPAVVFLLSAWLARPTARLGASTARSS